MIEQKITIDFDPSSIDISSENKNGWLVKDIKILPCGEHSKVLMVFERILPI